MNECKFQNTSNADKVKEKELNIYIIISDCWESYSSNKTLWVTVT